MGLDRVTFAVALKIHRDRLGLTQAEAATLLEVSPRVYWQWEKGMSNALVVTMEGVLARLKAAKKK
jgi:DNA-binding XRE family transcriptional regulator